MQTRKTGYCGIFSVPDPWEITITSLSEQQSRMDFSIHYNSPLLQCPVCAQCSGIVEIVPITWKSARHIEYDIYMTAYLPMIADHSKDCRLIGNPIALRDMLLIDLIMKKITYNWDVNPVQDYLRAAGPTNFPYEKRR